MKEKYHISLIMIVLSLALFSSYHIYYYFLNQKDDVLIEKYFNKSEAVIDNVNLVSETVNKENEINEEEYLGIIEIPKIKLQEGFFGVLSKNNNVSTSVTLLSSSVMPDKDNSIIYLAAHSGTGYLAFFKNLNKLTNEDIINITYKNKKYTYTITDIYEYPKIGSIIVNRNINDDYLVLTTCSNHKDMQTVIVSKLIKKI